MQSAARAARLAARAAAPGDSVGFIRMTRLATPGQYAVTGAVTGETQKQVVLYNRGIEVYRDLRSAGPALPVAKLKPACLACGMSWNDALGAQSGEPNSPPSLGC